MPNSAEGKPLGATNRLATRLYDARFRPHSPTITEIMQRYSGRTSIKTAPISYNKHKWFTGWQRFAINPFAKPARDKRNGVPPCYAPTAQPRTPPRRTPKRLSHPKRLPRRTPKRLSHPKRLPRPRRPQLLPHLPRRFRRPHPQRPPHRFLLQRQLRQSPSSLRSHRSNMLPLSNPPRRNRPTPLPRSSRTAHRSRLTAFPCLRKHTLWREAIRRFASSRSS